MPNVKNLIDMENVYCYLLLFDTAETTLGESYAKELGKIPLADIPVRIIILDISEDFVIN